MRKKAVTELPEKKAEKGKHLTPKQWAEAKALWESGEVTAEMLGEKYKKHPTLFAKRFRKDGIVKGSKKDEHTQRVKEEIARKAVDDAAILAARIRETKEEHYKMSTGLAKLTWAEILKAKQEGAPVAVAMGNLKALEAAMNVLKKAREERYAVLGLDKEDFVDEEGLPELVISELTAEQIEELRARENEDIGLFSVDDVVQGEGQVPDEDGDEDEVVEES